MRIVFLGVDDEFAGNMQRYVYERHPDWVAGSVISTCAIYKKTKVAATMFILQRSGFRYGAEMFKMKIIRKVLQTEGKTTPSRLAQRHGVEVFYCDDINHDASVERLVAWNPDLVISTNFSHYVGARARRVAKIGTWNLHKAYLPQYRGMAPSFYALLNGERQVGVTLHQITRGIDTGDIIRQVRVPVEPSDSVYSLNRRTSDIGGRMLADLLDEQHPDGFPAFPQLEGDWPNYSYPSREHVRAFLKKGLRF